MKKNPTSEDVERLYSMAETYLQTLETLVRQYRKERCKIWSILSKSQRVIPEADKVVCRVEDIAVSVEGIEKDIDKKLKNFETKWNRKYVVMQSGLVQLQELARVSFRRNTE